MKSEHRHELKTNDLAKHLITFQDYVKEYGGRVALGIVIVILAIILIVQRMNNAKVQEAATANNLAYVRSQVDRLSHVQGSMSGQVSVTPAEVADVTKVIADIREKSSDKRILAEVRVAEGDYAWALANYPMFPAATTQASLRPSKPRADLIKDAKAAYQDVLGQYGDQKLAVISARMGLAVIAEDAKAWDEAKANYEAITKIDDVNPMFKSLAEAKLKAVELIKSPILVGTVLDSAPAPKLDLPPSTTTGPTSQSTTKAAPTTKPASTPTTTTKSSK